VIEAIHGHYLTHAHCITAYEPLFSQLAVVALLAHALAQKLMPVIRQYCEVTATVFHIHHLEYILVKGVLY
jgi:hypothetical protein